MSTHLLAIIIGIIVLAITIWLFLPKIGLVSLLRKGKKNTEKILMEDILKYVYDCEYKDIPCGTLMIIEHINDSEDTINSIIESLVQLELIEINNNQIYLSTEGRSYALRIIRVHRIWERYLADETGITEMEWHPRADNKEHYLTLSDANSLAATMGNPVFDPHGDPIPSEEGLIPLHKGLALSQFSVGDIVNVLHIEDEPDMIYAQLVALGIHAHMRLKILEVTKDRIRFMTDTEELVLAPLFAENITAVLLEEPPSFDKTAELLSNLKLGKSAKIIGISPACRGQQRRRLMDLGVIPGSDITALMKSPSGEPTAYQVMGSTIAFRDDQAKYILIEKTV